MLEREDIITQLHSEAAVLLQQRKADEEIINHLLMKGVERHYAETVLDNVKEDAADKVGFRNTFLYGLAFLVLGAILTYASYHFAVKAGILFYLLFWGLIVAGISFIARAFIIFKK